MRVFYFLSKKYAFCNIEKSRIKIATINQLNDPYEFYFNFCAVDETHLTDIKNNYHNILGFLCFSEQMNNPVLWAHYADNHKGLCLEFEIPSGLLKKIIYREEPLTICSSDQNIKDRFCEATLSKYIHWSYESEQRLPIRLENKEIIRENGMFFMPLSDELSLKTVYSGLHCRLCEDERALLKEKGIELIKTAKSRTSYSINTHSVTNLQKVI